MALSEPKFQEGEKILCFHGPLIYEAKVQKMEEKDGRRRYFIHYHGWNKNWDEWVLEPRMLKHNNQNLEKKKDLMKAHEANAPSSKRARRRAPPPQGEEGGGESKGEEAGPSSGSSTSSAPLPSSSTAEPSEPDSDITIQSEEVFRNKVEVRIKIPDELKPYLVDDWDYLTKQRKLCILPTRVTVEQIIQDYVKSKTSSRAGSKTNKESAILEVTTGLREYFNVMLGSQLLYKFEREQHADLLKEHGENMPMSKIYGAIHLLRLFVKLGGILTYTLLDEKSMQLLLYYIHDFLAYMKKNASTLFSITDYGTAAPEYHRRSL